MTHIKNKKHGFSLIELMIVIAIIGILMAMMLPSYQTYIRRAHYVELVEATAPYKMSVQECFQMTSDLAQCNEGQQGVMPGSDQGVGIVSSIHVSNAGIITATPKSVNGFTEQDDYVLTPKITNEQLTWSISGGGVKHGYTHG